MRVRLNLLATATVVASVLGDVLANVAGVILETVAARGGRRWSPGLVRRETAVTGGRCNNCQLGIAGRIEDLGRTSRGVPVSHVDGRQEG